MKKYRCKVGFLLDRYDDDGFYTDEYEEVEEGSVFERSEDWHRIAGGPDSIRLENGKQWMEITQDYLDAYFEPIDEERKE